MWRILTREAVAAYNKNNPEEDDLIYDEVMKELRENFDFAVESLTEELIDTKSRWFDRHGHFTEFLSISDELIDTGEFASKVCTQVKIINGAAY